MGLPSFSIGDEYVSLTHKVDRFLKESLGETTIIVDAYFGPSFPEIPEKSIDPDGLLKELKGIQATISKAVSTEPRRTFLLQQIDAMMLLVRFGLEEPVTFEQRVQIGLDADLVTFSNERLEELHDLAYRMLRRRERKADLATMARQWRKHGTIKGNDVLRLAKEAATIARQSTQRLLFELPETEHVEFQPVQDAPWSAYNHYKGNFSALIEINMKLPHNKYALWSWVTHETYPGHQTQLVSRELGYQQGTLGLEATVAIINTPDCTIVEGLAESGTNILAQEHPLSESEQITNQLKILRRAVGINGLVMLHQQKRSETEVLEYLIDFGALEAEYAKSRLPFMLDPMWAPYGFTYFVGGWLVNAFFYATQEANIPDEFIRALFYELHTPSTLRNRIHELKLKLPAITE